MVNVEDLSRGDLLRMAEELTKLASNVSSGDASLTPRNVKGTPRDPAVRTLAAMMLNRLKNIDKLSFAEISALVGGISRERMHQLYHELVGDETATEKLNAK